jgi:DNA-directed RNA polymerase subunit alpha
MSIALPKKIDFAPNGAHRGTVAIEPLHPGFGITLGNSLRRVLLSSLPGAAAIGVKIAGIDHEFMPIPHVKEDVLELVMNLKKLRIKVHSDQVVKLELAAHGAKSVTAADIARNPEVEIVNPEMEICHLTDMAGAIKAEIAVAKGMGYETVESRDSLTNPNYEKKDKEIGYIEMDSIFTPVLNVGLKIEPVRVGKMTNWERLVLDIVTDGTISPEQAFEESVKILIGQFSALAIGREEDRKAETGSEEAEEGVLKQEAEEEAEDDDKPKKKRGRPKKEEE